MNVKISSKEHDIIKRINKLNNFSKYRKKELEFVIEGLRLCFDAISSGIKPIAMLYTESALKKNSSIINEFKNRSIKSYCISDEISGYLAQTKNPQGIFFICNLLDKPICFDTIDNKDNVLLLENLQDPSNLGTILRTAEALGIQKVAMTKSCCDLYNPKVVRGSMGAIFRLEFSIIDSVGEYINKLSELGFKSYATVPDKEALDITKVCFSEKTLILIGNEGNGLSEKTISSCDYKITIPMLGLAESLNAATAASIVLWEVMRER